MENFKKEYIDSGLWTWLIVIIPILFFIGVCIYSSLPTQDTLTPEPEYTGNCHHWSEAKKWVNQETCIWGFPMSTATGSWVWLHFSERSNPYPDFAADIDDFFGGDVKFTANNIAAKYVGHCVEVYGKVVIESNSYQGKTAQQPVIHVNSASDMKFCDDKFSNSP